MVYRLGIRLFCDFVLFVRSYTCTITKMNEISIKQTFSDSIHIWNIYSKMYCIAVLNTYTNQTHINNNHFPLFTYCMQKGGGGLCFFVYTYMSIKYPKQYREHHTSAYSYRNEIGRGHRISLP